VDTIGRMDKSLMEAALVGLRAQRERIDDQINMLERELGKRGPGRPASMASSKSPQKAAKKRRTMSPEARERIAAAQRKRWAAVRKAKK